MRLLCRSSATRVPIRSRVSAVVASLLDVGVTMYAVAERSAVSAGRPTTLGGTTRPPNKGMKLTKPSVLELRSLSLCWADQLQDDGTDARLALRRINSRCLSRAAGLSSSRRVCARGRERSPLHSLGLSRLALQRGASLVDQRRYHC